MENPKQTSAKGEAHERECDCHHDTLGGIMFGVIAIWLGLVLFLNNRDVFAWGVHWVWYFLFGLGVILLIEIVVRNVVPEYRQRTGGKLVAAVALMVLGAWQVTGLGDWWPLLLVIAGIIIIVHGLRGKEKSEE